MEDLDCAYLLHNFINFRKPKTHDDTKVSDTVRVVTKWYPNHLKQMFAYIETYLLSTDPRIRSEHHIQPAFKIGYARKCHKAIVWRCRSVLGLQQEAPDVQKSETPRMLSQVILPGSLP